MDEKERLRKAVDEFALKMKAKLLEKHAEGYVGWDDAGNYNEIAQLLMMTTLQLIEGEEHQAVNVANYAMMMDRFSK